MKTEHINNLISLVAMAVDEMHRGDEYAYQKAEFHLLKHHKLYGSISEEIHEHFCNVLSHIESALGLDNIE